MNGRYTLDKGNAKLLGVCAGLARWADVDLMLARVTMVMLTLFLGPIALLTYMVAAMVANPRG